MTVLHGAEEHRSQTLMLIDVCQDAVLLLDFLFVVVVQSSSSSRRRPRPTHDHTVVVCPVVVCFIVVVVGRVESSSSVDVSLVGEE